MVRTDKSMVIVNQNEQGKRERNMTLNVKKMLASLLKCNCQNIEVGFSEQS